VSTPETFRAVYRNIKKLNKSHLVGQLLNSIHGARTDVYRMCCSSKIIGVIFNSVIDTLHTYYRNSVADLATRNRLGGKGIESLWGPDFQCQSKTAPRPTQPHVTKDSVFYPRKRWLGFRADDPPFSIAVITNGSYLYLCFPLCLLGTSRGELFYVHVKWSNFCDMACR